LRRSTFQWLGLSDGNANGIFSLPQCSKPDRNPAHSRRLAAFAKGKMNER
jgi:hypothetical protein